MMLRWSYMTEGWPFTEQGKAGTRACPSHSCPDPWSPGGGGEDLGDLDLVLTFRVARHQSLNPATPLTKRDSGQVPELL